MTSTWLILNGGKPEPPDLRPALAVRREGGAEIRVLPTFEAGDARRLARDAARLGVELVVAAGGDGTVHEVACGLLEAEDPPALALLPLGTGNDLARSLGLPLANLPAALELALEAPEAPLDVIRSGSRAFVNMATHGPGCQVTAETPEELKDLLGRGAYLLSGLASLGGLEPLDLEVRTPDAAWRGQALAVSVGNGRCAGGGTPLCPEARVDDGALDLSVVLVPEGASVTEVLTRLLAAGPEGCPELLWTAQAARAEVRVEGYEASRWNLDGEPVDLEGPWVPFEVDAGALRVRRPAAEPEPEPEPEPA